MGILVALHHPKQSKTKWSYQSQRQAIWSQKIRSMENKQSSWYLANTSPICPEIRIWVFLRRLFRLKEADHLLMSIFDANNSGSRGVMLKTWVLVQLRQSAPTQKPNIVKAAESRQGFAETIVWRETTCCWLFNCSHVNFIFACDNSFPVFFVAVRLYLAWTGKPCNILRQLGIRNLNYVLIICACIYPHLCA